MGSYLGKTFFVKQTVHVYQEIFEPKTVFQGLHPKEVGPVDKVLEGVFVATVYI